MALNSPATLRRSKMTVWSRHLWAMTRELLVFLWKAFRGKHGAGAFKLLAFQGGRAYQRFLTSFSEANADFGDLFSERMERLRVRVEGLHSLLPSTSPELGYSILIPVYKPDADFLKKALRAAIHQTARRLEVLVGLDGPQPSAVTTAIEDIRRDFPKAKVVLRVVSFQKRSGISEATNQLAREARYSHLLLMDHDDWIRPDLLYRYELALRLQRDPRQVILYCNEYKINEREEIIAGSHVRKPLQPAFPYLFQNLITHCLLVPRELFLSAGGLRSDCDGAQDFDLCLRLHAAGASFANVPFFLYAWRSHEASTALNARQKSGADGAGLKAMRDYVRLRQLKWEVSEGMLPNTFRAVPAIEGVPTVHVIMPYRDQREMTLRAAKRLFDAQGVKVMLTAVDNGSSDHGISESLVFMGAEVIRIDEPFNYARLNNQGVKRSRYSDKADLLLFLNNDVELDPDALLEMARWIRQPEVGAIGARLHYPDGGLQHGGIDLDPESSGDRLTWSHTEAGLPECLLARTAVIRDCEAVTAACMLITRAVFERAGGFDEVNYPIAYSDTYLCRKLRQMGHRVLYTPFARGVHHEGVTRGKSAIEDFESSTWLDAQVVKKG